MQSYKEALQLFQKNSLNLPMKEHENKLNIMLKYILHELEKDKKELSILRQEIIHESYLQSSINDETSTSFINKQQTLLEALGNWKKNQTMKPMKQIIKNM